jgi:hypothetical protein
MRAGEAFVECVEKTGFIGFEVFRAGRQPRFARAKTAPGGRNENSIKDKPLQITDWMYN